MQRFPSPSSGLKYKVLSLPPKFPLDTDSQERSVSTMAYALRGIHHNRNRSLSLGLLPTKDDTAPRTANIITYPDHPIWNLNTGEQVLQFLEQDFPQVPIRQIVSINEANQFAQSDGGVFPVPQFSPRLHYLLKPDSERISAGVLLLGDAIHCFPPDIGQGVNAALEDVSVLNDTLCQSHDDLAEALPQYETVRLPDVKAVTRLAQIGAPWQYNQNRWRGRLWTMQVFLRFGISRLLPIVSPPAFFLLQNYQQSYQEIWHREQQGGQRLKVLSLILVSGFLISGTILLLVSRWD
jgi:2-polyprenyl-6-methoxyphenol hydroxylase-like FAD-dependent oxidoreductase